MMKDIENNWNFEDYPTETWKNPNAGEKKVAYGAGIINWDGMVGHGETPEKALIALNEKFKLYKDNNAILPKPGTKVPLKFASASNMEKYEKMAVDFFVKIFDINYYECFISDESSLPDIESHLESYEGDESNIQNTCKENIIKKTLSVYNVDIADVYDFPIWKVLEKIEIKKTK